MRLVSTLGLAFVVVFALASGAIATPSTTVVISEFRTRGPLGQTDELVELYNLSASSVDLTGWTLRRSTNVGATAPDGNFLAGTVLGPGCHFLFTSQVSSSATPGDRRLIFSGFLPDDGGIALLDGSSTIIDQVGMSAGSAYKEGTVLAPLTADVDTSYERKPGGLVGNGQDTDDNASDFSLLSPSQPQNLASPCIAFPTATESESWGAVKGLFR